MTDICIIKQFGGCSCSDGECAEQTRHQRTADLFAQEAATRQRILRIEKIMANAAYALGTIAFIGILYASMSSADHSFKNADLRNQESVAWRK